MQRELMERIRALMDKGVADQVLAWKRGEFFYDTEPAILTKDELGEMVYDSFCGPNLSKYLIKEMPKIENKILALIKPCDSYSLNQLITEHRIDRDKVYVIGVGCKGKIDVDKIRAKGVSGITGVDENGDKITVHTLYGDTTLDRKDVLLGKCLFCKGKEHRIADETVGESEDTSEGSDRFEMVKKLEQMTPDERFSFWRKELSKCIRCNACRNVCPACSCVKCVFDNPNTGVQNKAAANEFEENLFHIIRAYHVAGRCTDCGECSRVCPQGIPLHLLNRKFISDINELYGTYQAGECAGQRHPLIDYTQEDSEPSIVHERGNNG